MNHQLCASIIGGSGPGKANVLLNVIRKNERTDIHKIYLNVKDSFESKNEVLINGREKVEIKKLKILKSSIDYSQIMDDVYENLEDYNP